MKRIAALAATAALALAFAAPAEASSKYTTKQKNQYWKLVSSVESDAKIVGKKSVISLGVSTCNLLRGGADLSDVVSLFGEIDDFYLVEDLVIASIAAAPVVLCKDQQYKFD